MEFPLELGHLANVLQSTFVELDLLIRHDATSDIRLRRVVEALCHASQDLLNLFILIVELVALRHVGREKQR